MVDSIPKKWGNVQSIHIKTHDSVALPIFNAAPDASLRIASDPSGPKKKKKKSVPKEAVKAPTPEVKPKRKAAGKASAVVAKKVAKKK